jgi:hypothetical protein
MADLNNLTTLAKRLRPLLGNYIQGLVGASIGEGPGIDLTVANDITTVGLGGDTVLVYHDNGDPVEEYATITLALASCVSGDAVFVPGGTFTENITIPAGVGVHSMGNRTTIAGTVTLGGANSHLMNITIAISDSSAGDLIGVIGPSSGMAYLRDVWISVTNNGAGNAYSIQVDDGDIEAMMGRMEAITNGGGDAIGMYCPAEKVGIGYSDNNLVYAQATNGGDGYAFKTEGGDMYAFGGFVEASTSPVGD